MTPRPRLPPPPPPPTYQPITKSHHFKPSILAFFAASPQKNHRWKKYIGNLSPIPRPSESVTIMISQKSKWFKRCPASNFKDISMDHEFSFQEKFISISKNFKFFKSACISTGKFKIHEKYQIFTYLSTVHDIAVHKVFGNLSGIQICPNLVIVNHQSQIYHTSGWSTGRPR